MLRRLPVMPAPDEMLMMEPPPAFRISGMTVFAPRNVPLTLMSITSSQISSVVSSKPCVLKIAALLTRMSTLPKRSTAALTALCQLDSSVTSRVTNRASPPDSPISETTFMPSSSSRSPITTFAPSRANMRASAAPMPREPPLIIATLPSSLIAPPF